MVHQKSESEASEGANRQRELHTNDHLANERTYLAWTRTGVAVLGLGFVVAKFGIFIRELGPTAIRHVSSGISTAFGTSLVLLGTALLILAAIHYVHVARAIEAHDFRWSAVPIVGLAAVLVICGLLLAIYLFLTG